MNEFDLKNIIKTNFKQNKYPNDKKENSNKTFILIINN